MPLDQAIRVLEVLKWPIVVLICFGISLAVFRGQLSELISRITSISGQGVKAATALSDSTLNAELCERDLPKTIVAVELRLQNCGDLQQRRPQKKSNLLLTISGIAIR
jgi:hypothetical protein